jgi:SNF2 family DNA or RNA helicase
MRGVFQYLICDESHQMKSETSARANALGVLAASVKKVIGMTGTLIGGKAGHVRSLLFRLAAGSLRAEDLSWEDSMEFARRYGRVDTIITEREPSGDNRRSKGKTRTSRQAEQPGIMPTLYGRHLIGNTVFLSLKDVAANLPPYREHPTPVCMSPELAGPYRDMEEKLKAAVKQLLRKGSHQLLSPMLHALLAYPDYPYDWKPIGYVDAKDGPHGRFVLVTTPPTLDRRTLWPKERKLLDILAQEKAQGRQSWVFCVYTSTHPVLDRLEKIVREAGYRVKVLEATQVPTRNRSEWIARNAPGVDVMISHPQPVGTGMTLFDAAGKHNFPTLIWYETGYDLFTLRQASRRSWRIGQKLPCHVHYLYYAETMQARAMALMARKLDASLAMEGQFSVEGLAAMSSDGGTLAMELAKSLMENIDFGETERVWAKCGEQGPEQEPEVSEPMAAIRDLTVDVRPLTPTEQLCLFGV